MDVHELKQCVAFERCCLVQLITLVEPPLQLSWGNDKQGSPAREGTEGAAPPTERVVIHDFSRFGYM